MHLDDALLVRGCHGVVGVTHGCQEPERLRRHRCTAQRREQLARFAVRFAIEHRPHGCGEHRRRASGQPAPRLDVAGANAGFWKPDRDINRDGGDVAITEQGRDGLGPAPRDGTAIDMGSDPPTPAAVDTCHPHIGDTASPCAST